MKRNIYNKGFTLTEVLMTAGILVIVMFAVAMFQVNIFSYNSIASGSFTTVQDAQTLLKIMNKEIRMISPGDDGSYAIQSTGTSTFMFFSDIDADGKKERIRYSMNGGKIYRAMTKSSGSPSVYLNSNEATSTILYNVNNATTTLLFQYFDKNYDGNDAPLSQPVTPTDVRLIKVSVTLDVDPKISPAPRTYTIQVMLRNLKDNL